MASAPGHPVIRNALNVTFDWYNNRYMNGLDIEDSFPQYYRDKFDLEEPGLANWGHLLGPDTVAVGLMMWGGVNRLNQSRMFDATSASEGFVFLLNQTVPE